MARIASKEIGLYYPTDLATVELIAQHIKPSCYAAYDTWIIDPCAGEGKAVNTFADALKRSFIREANKLEAESSRYYRGSAYQPSPGYHLHESAKRVHVKGVELDYTRAEAAAELLGHNNVLQGAAENVGLIGQFDIMWLNPPYDYVAGRRTELVWIEMTQNYLRSDGLAIFVVPDMFVRYSDDPETGRYMDEMRRSLVKSGYKNSFVLRFPDQSWPQFKQVAIFATKDDRSSSNRYIDLNVQGKLGEKGTKYHENYIRHSVTRNYVTLPTITMALDTPPLESVFANDEVVPAMIDFLGDPNGLAHAMRPLTPMRREHAALAAAAGMFNGHNIGGRLIKGSTIKKVQRIVTDSVTQSGGSDVRQIVDSEVLAAQLSILNMESATITTVNSIDHPEEFEPILSENAEEFVNLAQQMFPPMFTEEDQWKYTETLAKIRAPRKIKGVQNGMFPQQTFRAASILDGWQRFKVITMVGEMGVGKTVVAAAAAATRAMQRKEHNRKIVILLPPKKDLLDKWEEEMEMALRLLFPKVFKVETISDVREAFSTSGLVIVLIKETTAKMTSGWAPIIIPEPRQPKSDTVRETRCPTCGDVLEYSEKKPQTVKSHCVTCQARGLDSAMWTVKRRVAGKKKDEEVKDEVPLDIKLWEEHIAKVQEDFATEGPVKRSVSWEYERLVEDADGNWVTEAVSGSTEVHEPSWVQPWEQKMATITPEGSARYPLAKYIRDHYSDQYILIIDECHGYKGEDTDRAYAAQDLLASATLAIQMTGTLYNGMASSIYYLLWRALPEFRKTWGRGDKQKFVNQYGLHEKITRDYTGRHTTGISGYGKSMERISEKPGIHPSMIALLMPSTVFFGIRDLEVILPNYSEHTVFVDRPEKFHVIEGYLSNVRAAAVAKMMKKDMSLMGQWVWATQGAWDMAHVGDYVDGHKMAPIECPWEMWPKEEALLRLVLQEKRLGRKVLAFVGQLNRRDNTNRLCELLERYGMKGAVMRSTVTERKKFILQALADGADVIFTSADLVKEGIDLLELPTFVWLFGSTQTYLVQQANRRAWRPGQEQECKIYYLAYNETPQAARMTRLAKKLQAAQAIAGDVRQGLAAILGEETFVNRLQDAVVETEHHESDLSMDDLPPLEKWVESRSTVSEFVETTTTTGENVVEVTVDVRASKRVRVHITVAEIEEYAQLTMF
jgi:hypothetical protein